MSHLVRHIKLSRSGTLLLPQIRKPDIATASFCQITINILVTIESCAFKQSPDIIFSGFGIYCLKLRKHLIQPIKNTLSSVNDPNASTIH